MINKILVVKNDRQNPTTDTYRLEDIPLNSVKKNDFLIVPEDISDVFSQLLQQVSEQLRNTADFKTSPPTRSKPEIQPPSFFLSSFSIQNSDSTGRLNVGDRVKATLVSVSDSKELEFLLSPENVAFIQGSLDESLNFSQNIVVSIVEDMLYSIYRSEGNIDKYFK